MENERTDRKKWTPSMLRCAKNNNTIFSEIFCTILPELKDAILRTTDGHYSSQNFRDSILFEGSDKI